MAKKPTISEPIEIGKFWKNRAGEAIVVQLSTINGRGFVDVRQWFTDAGGHLKPSQKGVTVSLLRLPDLLAALTKASQRARDLGGDGDGEAG